MENKITVYASLRIKAGKESEFKEVAKAVVEQTRQESACLRYDLLEDVLDNCVFSFFEEYANEAGFAEHRGKKYMEEFRLKRNELVQEYLGVKILKQIKES